MPADDVHIEWGDGSPPPQFAAMAHDAGDPESPGADARWAVARAGGAPAARLATYVRHDLTGAPGASGVIGHYAARDAASGVALLRDALSRLRAAGVRRVLGPMNGSTWARYRFALPSPPGAPDEPAFLGEPTNPDEYPAHFAAAGFRTAAMYESRIATVLAAENPRARAAEETAAARGIRVAPLELDAFEHTLHDLHALSVRAFAENAYYSPIDGATFGAMYRPMRGMLDPELVLLARAPDGELAGYAFAYVDPLARRDGHPDRLIVKTLATSPAWRSIGLGALLVERLHAAARRKGIGTIVHALMHATNNSVRISAHTARVFRQYALYEHAWSGEGGG